MDFEEYVKRGTALYQEKKFDLALKEFKKAQEKQPDNADIHPVIEMINAQIELQKKGRQAAANEAELQKKISKDLWGITDVDDAITEYTRALKRNPKDNSAKEILAFSYYIRGLMFKSEGKDALAIGAYDEAIKNMPDFPKAINRRGEACGEVGDYEQAIEDYKKLTGLQPDDSQWKKSLANAYSARGMAYDNDGDYKNAVKDYEMALEFDPDNSEIRQLLEMAKAE